jgi:ubiquinone biosynthesis protein UbiJ
MVVAAALQVALRAYLSADALSRERFGELADRAFALQIQGLDMELFILPDADGLKVVTELDREADVVISGTPLGLSRLAAGDVAGAGVTFKGDTGLAQRLRELLMAVDFDWEEPIARLLGDVAAHQIGNVIRGFAAWGGNLARSLIRDTDEYLHEERRDLPPREDIDRFLEDVDDFRTDVDRLEARVRRLRPAPSERSAG